MSFDQLLELLWDGEPPRSARATVHTYVARLRAVLQPHDVGLHTRGDAYLVDVAPEQVDVHRFVSAATRAQQVSDPAERAAALADALAWWRGPLMADVADDRLRDRIGTSLDELRLTTVELVADAQLACGRHHQVVADLVDPVARHPTREHLVELLVTALYRCGRQTEALELYRDTRTLLQRGFGIDPGARLDTLHRQVLKNDPALELPTVPTPGRAAATQAGRGGRRNLLPRDIPDFTGRIEELVRLDTLLDATDGVRSAVVITAIAGTAGVGKTALAVRWASRAAERFPDAQLYVDLRGYDRGLPVRPIDALARLLRALGVPAERIPSDLDDAIDLYRGTLADQHALIVLDNARSVDQVRPLLPGGPRCVVVVTSRDRLGGLVARDSAIPLVLGLLSPQESVELLTRILGAERVAAQPAATTQLAQRCGYLPLALRIAAANLVHNPGRSLAEYVEQLTAGERLAALAVEGDPHSAVRCVFDQSYAALGTSQRRLFRSFGLVALPDLTAETAAALTDTTPPAAAAAILHQLHAVHLVTEPAPGRYTPHDLLREYAIERCQAEDTLADCEAAIRRLLSWYLHRVDALARSAYPQMLRLHTVDPPAFAFDSPAEAATWYAAEKANLLATVTHAAEHGPHEMSWLLADGLRGQLWHTHDSVASLAVGEAVLRAAQWAGDRRPEALAHLTLGAAHRWQLRYDLAANHNELCAKLSAETGWLGGEAAAVNALGTVCIDVGRLAEGAQHLERALDLNRRAGRRQAQGTVLSNLGYLYLRTGPLDRAAECLLDALKICRDAGGGTSEATILNTLGAVAHHQGRFEAAERYQNEALAIHTALGNEFGKANILDDLADLYQHIGRLDDALQHAESAIELVRRSGDRANEANYLNTLGFIRDQLDQHPAAISLHEKALGLATQAKTALTETYALIGLATAHRHNGELDLALGYARQAVTTAERAGLSLLKGTAITALAEIHVDRGSIHEAARCAQAALDIHQPAGHQLNQPRAHAALLRCQTVQPTPDQNGATPPASLAATTIDGTPTP